MKSYLYQHLKIMEKFKIVLTHNSIHIQDSPLRPTEHTIFSAAHRAVFNVKDLHSCAP